MHSNKLHAKKNLLNYGIIGNCKSSALIFEDSSINWCCLPQFDSSSVFGKILDDEIGGHFKITVDDSYFISQNYYNNTAILKTNFKNNECEFELIDYMPRFKNDDGSYYSSPEIHRILIPIKGNPKIKVEYEPKLEYSVGKTVNYLKKNFIVSVVEDKNYETLFLYTDLDKKDIQNDLRWGIYIVLKAKNEYVKNCFKDYGMVTDSSGNYSAIWRPYHYIGLELAQSIYSIALDNRATGFTKNYNAEVASIAKKDLSKITAKVNEIAVNVCKQCGNNLLPSFSYFSSLVNALKDIQSSNQIYCFDTEAESYFDQQELENNLVTIITGPESGFSDKELVELTSMQEIKMRYLGENILRAETAPIVVSSVIKNHFGRI